MKYNEPAYQLRQLNIPDFVYTDSSITFIQAKVYSYIHTFKSDRFYWTNLQLASLFKVSEWSISQAVQKLVLLGLISVKYKMKADGGKIRFIVDLKSDCGSTYSPTVGVPTVIDNKIDVFISKDINDKPVSYGNSLVNFILDWFDTRYGFQPLDRSPRFPAANLSRAVTKLIKAENPDFTRMSLDDRAKGVLTAYFKWLEGQEWSANIKNMSAVYKNFGVFSAQELGRKRAVSK